MHLSITTKEEAIRVDQFFQSYEEPKRPSPKASELDTLYYLLFQSRKQTHEMGTTCPFSPKN